MQQDELSLLRDIHLPEAVPWWPLSIGWWVLLIILTMICTGIIWQVVRDSIGIRGQALKDLNQLKRQFANAEIELAEVAKALSVLVKRVAIVSSSRQKGVFTEDQWQLYLTQGKHGMDSSIAIYLSQVAYSPTPLVTPSFTQQQLFVCVKKWIRTHT